MEGCPSGSSYLSQSELVLTFGLGSKLWADQVEIQWPSGQIDRLTNVSSGQTVTVEEGKGITNRRQYQATRSRTLRNTVAESRVAAVRPARLERLLRARKC